MMKSVGKKLICLQIDVFDMDVTVGVNLTEADFRMRFKRTLKNKDRVTDCDPALRGWDSDDALGRVMMTKGGVIILLRIKQLLGEMGTISHEMSHAATEIMALVGVPISRDTDEVHAYMVGYLVQKCVDGISHRGRHQGADDAPGHGITTGEER